MGILLLKLERQRSYFNKNTQKRQSSVDLPNQYKFFDKSASD
jgi:hypothetical protein